MLFSGWLRQLAEQAAPGCGAGELVVSPSGATLLVAGPVVVKLHREGTDGDALAVRLRVARDVHGLLAPCSDEPARAPGPAVRWASIWPRVEPLHAAVGDPDGPPRYPAHRGHPGSRPADCSPASIGRQGPRPAWDRCSASRRTGQRTGHAGPWTG